MARSEYAAKSIQADIDALRARGAERAANTTAMAVRIAERKKAARKLAADARKSEREAQRSAVAASESLSVHGDASTPGSSIRQCYCYQGFSGANAQERLDAHIANPNANSTAALLQKVMV